MYASDLKEGNPVVLRAKTILLSWFKKKKKKNLALLNYAIIYTYCFRCKIHRLVDCLTTIRNPCRSCSCGCTHIHRHSAFPKLPRCNCTIHWMADMQIVLKYMTKKKNKQFFYLYKCFSPVIRYDIIVTEWNVIRFTIHKIVFFLLHRPINYSFRMFSVVVTSWRYRFTFAIDGTYKSRAIRHYAFACAG